jgi:hypothetical protein
MRRDFDTVPVGGVERQRRECIDRMHIQPNLIRFDQMPQTGEQGCGIADWRLALAECPTGMLAECWSDAMTPRVQIILFHDALPGYSVAATCCAIQSQSQPDAARSACRVQRLQAHSAAKPETRAHFAMACWPVVYSEQRTLRDIIAPFAFVAVRDVLQVFTNVEEGWMYHYST